MYTVTRVHRIVEVLTTVEHVYNNNFDIGFSYYTESKFSFKKVLPLYYLDQAWPGNLNRFFIIETSIYPSLLRIGSRKKKKK